ncbi:ABC transporter substrate-binding protein [Paenibacillus doosanensis]|uniref:ABC transporter substrate-binding protein n=1 Tax=Paenibacillus doosanensis TaxID=1229154 RepID=UPI00217FF4CA|nr:ABC transporter substrate-binding protein [Paenibacillus doosanensis]MCS7458637.1 ABC transporter substrate-binding protein [Paenibacillus doosanensis]
MLEQYYLTIRRQLPNATEGEEAEVTLQQLADWLHFSGRNVNIILKKMEELSWIRWIPGRGRGHRSRMAFRVTRESLVLKMAEEHVARGDLQQAFACIDEHAYLPSLRDQFVYWLDSHFGYRPEQHHEERTDTLRIPYHKPILCMDPAFITFVVESHMAKQIFDGIVRYNHHTRTIEPHIAHFWIRSEDETEWIFYLRKGVLFHHGRELTARDVKFSLDRIRDEHVDSPYRWMFQDVVCIEALDRYAIRIRLAQPNSLFLHFLSFDRASIVPEDLVSSQGAAFKRHPVGTGPFQVVQHDANMFVCEAFPRYFDKRAHLDRLEIWYTPDLECKASGYERTMYRIRTPGEEDSHERWNKVEMISRGSKMLTFNLRMQGPQRQLCFRQAVVHGIDRKKLELLHTPEDARLADWFIYEHHPSDQETLYNPQLARELLRQSGYDGEELVLGASQAYLEEAGALAALFAEMGVNVCVQTLDNDSCGRIEGGRRSHMCLGTIILDDDLVLSVIELFMADNSLVHRHLSDELLQEMRPLFQQIYAAECESGPGGQSEGLKRLEKLVKSRAAVFFLYHWQQRTLYHPSLRGVSLNALGWVPFRDVWFEPVSLEPTNFSAAF